jgi:hypothetical protein
MYGSTDFCEMAATYSEKDKSTPLEDESAVMAVAKEMARNVVDRVVDAATKPRKISKVSFRVLMNVFGVAKIRCVEIGGYHNHYGKAFNSIVYRPVVYLDRVVRENTGVILCRTRTESALEENGTGWTIA